MDPFHFLDFPEEIYSAICERLPVYSYLYLSFTCKQTRVRMDEGILRKGLLSNKEILHCNYRTNLFFCLAFTDYAKFHPDKSWNTYITRHAKMYSINRISGKLKTTLNHFINKFISKISVRAGCFLSITGLRTITGKSIQAAMCFLLLEYSIVLQKTLILARKKYTLYQSSLYGKKTRRRFKSERAGLIFPVPKISTMMMQEIKQSDVVDSGIRKSVSASIFLTSHIESLLGEMWKACLQIPRKSKTLDLKHFRRALDLNPHLKKIVKL